MTLSKDKKILKRIKNIKDKLGKSLIILGHHYQSDEVIQFADIQGDSLDLSRKASQEKQAVNIVFCGVHFMAETADILSKSNQRVFLPDLKAGCPLADMADIFQVADAWAQLGKVVSSITPITYVNASAKIKAFCGKHQGIVCTSTNAEIVFDWALEQNRKIIFFPDEHLGRNTALKKGIGEDEMVVWFPGKVLGGNTEKEVKRAKVILWKGFCHVHTHFRPKQINKIRQQHKDINIIVHPECKKEVVEISDFNGSTSFIIKKIKESAPGTKWAIGTEINLVNRLSKECSDKFIIPISRSLCPNMFKINIYNLYSTLKSISSGRGINEIKVDKEVSYWAKLALNKMLEL